MSDASQQDAVTLRWAEALFQVADRAGATEEVRQDAERLSAEASVPAVRAFLFGGAASQSERSSKLGPLLETLHPLTRNFVKLLFDKRRQEVLVGIGDAFKARVLASQGAVEGVVTSARELDDEQRAAVAKAIGERMGKTVHLRSEVDPELVGGLRVIVGSQMLDQTVQGRLSALRQRLLEAPLPAPVS